MKTDKSRINLEAELVYDESLRGIEVDDLHGKSGLDFKDDGMAKIPKSAKSLYCSGSKVPSKSFKKRYDKIAWECEHCGNMHPKGVKCK